MNTALLDRFPPWLVRHARPVLVGLLIVIAACAAGVARLQIDDDLYAFFPPDHPHLLAATEFEALFGDRNSIHFVLVPPANDIFTRSNLFALHALHDAAERLPYAVSAASLARQPRLYIENDILHVEPYVELADDLSAAELRTLRERVLADPLMVHRLVSASGQAATVSVRLALPDGPGAEAARREVVAAALAVRDEARQRHPELEVQVNGEMFLEEAFQRAVRRDIGILMPAMILVAFAVVSLTVQSVRMVFATWMVISLAGVAAIGLASWFGWPLSSVSSSALGLIITLSVADCIHMVTTVAANLRAGDARAAAIEKALRVNLWPIFLTSFSTAIGFLTLHFMNSRPFADLGNIIATGVMIAFLLSVTLLPALLAIVLPATWHSPGRAALPRLLRSLDAVTARRRWMVGLILLAMVSMSGLARLELDCGHRQIWGTRLEARRAADVHMDRMGVHGVLHHMLDAAEVGGITAPDYLDVVDRFAEWYRGQPNVVHVLSLADHLRRLHALLEGEEPESVDWPIAQEAAAQLLFLSEMSFPPGGGLLGSVDVTQGLSIVTVLTEHLTVQEWIAMERRAQDWLATYGLPSMHGIGVGQGLMWAHLTRDGAVKTLGGVLATLTLIALLLGITQRSVRIGMISFVANLLPMCIAFGIWGLLGRSIGVSGAAIAGMTVGIVVDDTIHFITRFGEARQVQGLLVEQAVRYAFGAVGPALIITSLALVAGFMVLIASPIVMVSVMGWLSALVILLALVMDLLLLPALLRSGSAAR